MPGVRRSMLSAAAAVAAGILLATAGPAAAQPAPGTGGPPGGQIVVTEQATDQILVFGTDERAWETAEPAWAWAPSEDNGLGEFTGNWGAPDEAKLRSIGDQQYLLTTDSFGLAAVVPYPQGEGAYWAADVARASNPHSIELLPDGNVAVVASHGNWLRVYTASQGPRSTEHLEVELEGGHGVHWDAANRLLWALGTHDLVAYELGGTPAAPELTEVRRATLPTEGGHDLTPVAADPDRFWVTSGTEVYQYSIADDAFTQDYEGAGTISREAVKAVGDHPETGQVVSTFIQESNICTWCTDTVRLDLPAGELTLRGGGIYKARWWVEPPR